MGSLDSRTGDSKQPCRDFSKSKATAGSESKLAFFGVQGVRPALRAVISSPPAARSGLSVRSRRTRRVRTLQEWRESDGLVVTSPGRAIIRPPKKADSATSSRKQCFRTGFYPKYDVVRTSATPVTEQLRAGFPYPSMERCRIYRLLRKNSLGVQRSIDT